MAKSIVKKTARLARLLAEGETDRTRLARRLYGGAAGGKELLRVSVLKHYLLFDKPAAGRLE
ncbi:MAG: hypothetical protein AB1446_07790 [Bacillota bacterium]